MNNKQVREHKVHPFRKNTSSKDLLSKLLSGVDLAGLEDNTLLFDSPDLRHGFVQLPNQVLKDNRLSSTDKIVYALLLSYAWQSRRCFPGRSTLASDVGCNLITITRSITHLEIYKLIRVERRGQGKVNIYHIRILSDAYPAIVDKGVAF